MNRRWFLAVSAAALAGCGQLPSSGTTTPEATGTATDTATATASPDPTGTPTGTPTETETAIPTDTETATPTETETPELSDREERAAASIARAIRELNRAVATYAGNEGESLLDVSAATERFSRLAVIGDLTDADDDLEAAEDLASRRQQPRLAAVREARRFLGFAVETQSRTIAAFGAVERGRGAVADEQETTVDSAAADVEDERGAAERTLGRIESETSAANVSVVPAIPAADYDAKVAQFAAEIDGFASLADFLRRLRQAVGDLNDAERFDRGESERRARERARAAAEAFETLAGELRTFATDLPESGAALVGVSNGLADVADRKAEKAREIESENS